ncbi:MAG: family 78 glycoside hydrolase catalytic domain [Verrucomicrobiota bacterium]
MNPSKISFLSLLSAVLWQFSLASSQAALAPGNLECEYHFDPLGIDAVPPRLTWQVESKDRDQHQTAYEILVASDEKSLQQNLGNVWDSGKIASDQTFNVEYAGKPLSSREVCFWKVKVWDQSGAASDWSPPARWSMGLLNSNDWQASYISYRDMTPVYTNRNGLFLPAARQYRKEFVAPKQIQRATIYATALGIYELHLNGHRVGDAVFAPGWTDYRQRAYYQTYDVTKLVNAGTNAVGAWVADGWYSGYIGFGLWVGLGTEKIGRYTYGKTPAFMAQLEIEYTDGSRDTIVTDPTWKVTGNGPIDQADILMGERYDARRELSGWADPGFNDSAWDPAIVAQDNGSVPVKFYTAVQDGTNAESADVEGIDRDIGFQRPPVLQASPGVPVRPLDQIKPIAITSPTNGVYIFNLGQNISGVARLRVKGPAGTQIQLRYGEMLYPDGTLMTKNLRKARATDYYILRGDSGVEIYQPRFTYHGFQYVEVTGYPGKPGKNAITGIAIHSATPPTSDFVCSDPVPNQLFKNIRWTQYDNFVDIPTDCPQRDERFGWMGDAQTYIRAATYNADVPAFYTKWLQSVMDAQRPSGTFPGYCPSPFDGGLDHGIAWSDAGVICPWTIWKIYGDTRIVQDCWQPMVRFMDWRKRTSRDFLGINQGNDWGDWLSFGGKTPLDFLDTVYFAYTSHMMSEMAAATGKDQESATYQQQFEDIKQAFNTKYVNPDGSLSVDTETAYVLALYVNLLPDNLRRTAGEILAGKINASATNDNSGITTGFLGTRPLLPVLSSVGQNDLAVKLFQSRKFPSWGYEVEQGATTVWERWNGYTRKDGFNDPGMNSFAHYSLGAVCEWMFFDLAGIDTDGVAYNHIIVRPTPPAAGSNHDVKPIDWVKAHYDSIHGRISSEWRQTGGRFELKVVIPANTTATVYIPARGIETVTESSHALDAAPGVKSVKMVDERAAIDIGSGSYDFVSVQ